MTATPNATRPVGSSAEPNLASRGRRGFLVFCLIALGLGWAIWVPAALSYHGLSGLRIPQLDGLVAWLPGIGALIAVGWESGRAGIKRLLVRFGRVEPWWLLATLAVVVAIGALSYGISVLIGVPPLATNFAAAPIAFLALLPWNLGEEIGWRGYLLPRLVAWGGLTRAGLLSGLIWATWHLPFWWKSPYFADPTRIAACWLGGIALGLILAWLVVRARYSLLVATLGHVAYNVMIATFGLTPPIGGDARPWLVLNAILVIGALAICLLHSRSGEAKVAS